MADMRIAIQFHPQHAEYDQIRRGVALAEEMGADVAYNWDHFYPLYGEPDGAHFECWTMLAAWAEATESIQFGPLVTCNSYRNPQLLADMARTVDHIAGGRLILGIGSGWFERDYDQYGYEFGTAPSRLRDLRRDLPIIESRLEKLNPAPTRKIPLLIGGGGEKVTLRLVAEHADIWHGFGSPETIGHKLDVLADHCEAVGRPYQDILKSTGVDHDKVTDVAEYGDALYDLGIREITLGVNGPLFDLKFAEEWLAWRSVKNAAD